MASRELPVLVVETDAETRERLVEVLYGAGLEVHGASSGDDALGVLGSHRSRWLVLLNLDTARVGGWAFLEALGVFEVPPDTFRVLIISAHPRAQELRSRPFVHGVLPRPYDVATLISAVREVAALPRRAG